MDLRRTMARCCCVFRPRHVRARPMDESLEGERGCARIVCGQITIDNQVEKRNRAIPKGDFPKFVILLEKRRVEYWQTK